VVFTIKVSNWRIAIAAQGQRDRFGRQYPRHRQPAQLRNGQVFQQRGIRSPRYDQQMQHWEDAATRSQVSLSWLNLGQQIIIAWGSRP
jgi:ABC-type transport system involved in Fe-S cluster assembly fused permease/ATPase subunit